MSTSDGSVLGTTQIFAETGECIPVTVLEAGPNTIVQKKTPERDGYAALQLGFGERRPSRTPKALAGHFQRANGAFRAVRLEAGRHLVEMVYRPSSVVAGAAVSAAGLLMGGAAGAARLLGGR